MDGVISYCVGLIVKRLYDATGGKNVFHWNVTFQEGQDSKSSTVAMLERLGVPSSEYQLGKTKVFLRKTGWLLIDQAFRSVMNNLKPLIVTLQSIYRAHKAKV